MANIKITNVKKIYQGGTVALQNCNLEIADKEFIVLVGPSGCGKSTLLRMIAGLEEITEGTIEIGGRVVNDLQPRDRDIAMVFQNYALYPHMNVYQNMAFPLKLKKIRVEIPAEKPGKKPRIKEVKLPQDEINKRIMDAAETLGITEYLMRKPRQLSGGQRQRVAIGRAMVRDSQVFLLDEPLSNLDAKLRNQMRAELILLRKKIDTTFIYVTHDQTEAMTLGDRIVVMKMGYIQQVGTPEQVFDMPNNLFVAEFIGSPKMNTFKARLEKDEKGYYVTPFGIRMPVDGEKGEKLALKNVEPQDIILGVRPEHITLTNSGNPTAVPCIIRVKEMMGSELHLHVDAPTGERLIVKIPTISLTMQQVASLRADARIYITFRSKVMHFFGSENKWNLLVDEEAPAYQVMAGETQEAPAKTEPKRKKFVPKLFRKD